MDSLDNVRERFAALAQQTEHWQQQTCLAERRLRCMLWSMRLLVAMLVVLALAAVRLSQAADFACAAGDVACLIVAINTANANGEANTITLEAGTYTLTAVDNTTDGPNGLPSVTGMVTIQGAGADATSLEREARVPGFRLGHVAATGNLTVDSLTIRGFGVSVVLPGPSLNGGGLFNQGGILTLDKVTLTNNRAEVGGGLFNNGGTVTLATTSLTSNHTGDAGGGPLCQRRQGPHHQ